MNTRYLLSLLSASSLSAAALGTPIYSMDFEGGTPDPAGLWSSTNLSNLGGPYTSVLGRFGAERVDFRLDATEENTSGFSGSGDGGNNDRPYNIGVRSYQFDRIRLPELDGGGGGGAGGGGNPGGFDTSTPRINLGDAIGGSNGGPSGDPLFSAGKYALTFDLMLFDSWDADYAGYGPDSFAVSVNGVKLFDELLEIHWLPNNFRLPDELPDLNVFNTAWQDQIYRDIELVFEVTDPMASFDISFIGSTNQSITDESWGIDNVRVDRLDVPRGTAPEVPAPASVLLLAGGLGLGANRRRRTC